MVSFDGFMNYVVELIDNMSSKTADHLRANPLVIAHCIGAMKIITAISIAKDSHVSMISRALFAPRKAIQDSLGFWIPHCGFWIPGVGFRILCQKNLDSGFQSLVGFRIPDSILDSSCCIPDSKAQDSGFHSKNWRILDSKRKKIPESLNTVL